MFGIRKQFDDWLAERLGSEQAAEIARKTGKEKVAEREAAVAEIAALAARRDAALAEIAPKVVAATERAKSASVEHLAAHNGLFALRRRRASVIESSARDVAKLERFLRQSADAKLDAFCDETRRMEEAVFCEAVLHETRPTERAGAWGVIAKIFSTRPTIEARIAAIGAARAEAEALKLLPGPDVEAALAAIRNSIPRGDFTFQDTGQEIEVSAF
jgi:hypothetical protein